MEKLLRSKRFTFRLTPQEYEQLQALYRESLSPNMGEYIRRVILRKPVIIKVRDVSVDYLVEEIVLLKRELNAIGHNLNQAVRKLNAFDHYSDVRSWLALYQPSIRLVFTKIDLITEKVLQVRQNSRHGSHL